MQTSKRLGVEYPWAALDLDNAVAAFGGWVRMQMAEAEAGLRRRRGKNTPSPADVQAVRERTFQMALYGRDTRVKRAKSGVQARATLGILGKLGEVVNVPPAS